jgi:type IV secretion system protein VirD4
LEYIDLDLLLEEEEFEESDFDQEDRKHGKSTQKIALGLRRET